MWMHGIVGGRDKIRPLWRHFYKDKDAVIFVVERDERGGFGLKPSRSGIFNVLVRCATRLV